ncbi:MAG: MazG nucleotide pyrophosphohydrolase domain-containing protein [Pseudonocardiaceae bacterium]
MGEEVGELFKAVRKQNRMRIDATSAIGTVDEELADILIYICAIANRLEISIENAWGCRRAARLRGRWSRSAFESHRLVIAAAGPTRTWRKRG